MIAHLLCLLRLHRWSAAEDGPFLSFTAGSVTHVKGEQHCTRRGCLKLREYDESGVLK